MIVQTSKKFFSEWGNGLSFSANASDFATHLKGNIGEKLRVVTELEVIRVTEGNQSNPIYVESDAYGLGKILRRVTGSWIDEGWLAGDTIYNIQDYNASANLQWSDTIVSVTDLIIILTTPRTGADLGLQGNNGFINASVSPHLTLKYNLVENSVNNPDTFSPYSNEQQYYYFDTIDTATPTDHTMKVGATNKNWYAGDAIVRWLSSSAPINIGVGINYCHKYRVTQDFIISPLFIEEYLSNYEDETNPEIFEGLKCPRYFAEYEFRTIATNSNTGQVFREDQIKGNVGWLNENYNGGVNPFSVSDVVYTDTASTDVVDSLQSSLKTTITGTINGSGFTNTNQVGLYFWHLAPLAQYSTNQGSLQNTFLYDRKLVTMVAGTITSTGTDRIKRLKVDYVSSTELTFEADIELTDAQKDYVGENSYFLGLQLGNSNAVDTSNKVMLQLDFNSWVIDNDVQGLVTFEKQGFKLHNQSISEAGYTDYKGFKQDGTLFTDTIILNKTLEANLKNVTFKLVVYNTNDDTYFELQKYNFNLGNVSNVKANPSYQILDVLETRKFKLANGDYFNNAQLTFYPISGTTQKADVSIGFKFDWQSWVKNPNADKIFSDSSLDSNGLGNDASRYSLSNGYEIRVRLECEVNQFDQTTQDYTLATTTYVDESPALEIHDFDEDGNTPADWSCLIQTFNANGDNLSGAILTTEDTRLRMTWTPQSGSTSDFLNAWAIHRIESYLAVGYGDIDELSSIRDSRIGNLLKPIVGEDYLKVTDSGTTIVTECLIDYTKIKGSEYNLTGRIGNIKIYGRYGYAGDIKFLNSAKTEAILFSTDGFPSSTNSLRLATLDSNYNVFLEERIALNTTYDYEFTRIVVDLSETSNGKAVFYMAHSGLNYSDLVVSRFVYNGTTFIQTVIATETLVGNGAGMCLKIDPALRPNSKAFLWYNNLNSNHKFSSVYWNGSAWIKTDMDVYTAGGGGTNTYLNPCDIGFHNGKMYIQNFDDGTGSAGTAQEKGKIGVWTQTSGSTVSPSDRSTFSNYTFSHNIYNNASNTENVDGSDASGGDLAFTMGFEIAEIDSNNNPIILLTGNPNSGGRHFVRIRSTVASPSAEADYIIETPMSDIDGVTGAQTALSGTASSSAHSSNLPYHNVCNLAIIDGDNFISGNTHYFFTRFTINSWTGASNNNWYICAPFDPNYNFTSGDILTK